jgi:hypothetical protein
MNTYLLTGNPEKKADPEDMTPPMRIDVYEETCRQVRDKGYADDHWTMLNQGSVEGDQVVLLRQGSKNPGLIAFGQRRKGEPIEGTGRRQEQPVRFYKARSINEDPYISLVELRKAGFWRLSNFPGSGTLLSDEELHALQACCEAMLGESLSELCSSSYGQAPSATEESYVRRDTDEGTPTTGPIPTPWTATVQHSLDAPAWTYALRFGDRRLWKVGQTEDLEKRLSDVNKHAPTEVLHEQWRPAFHQRWGNAILAQKMEQKVFGLLATQRTIGERIQCSELDLETAWTSAAAAVWAQDHRSEKGDTKRMDKVWAFEVDTTLGRKWYHVALDSEADARQKLLDHNAGENPKILNAKWVDNSQKIEDGAYRQVVP